MKFQLPMIAVFFTSTSFVRAEETFVTIQKVSGSRLTIVKNEAGGRGRGRSMRGGFGGRFRGRGRAGFSQSQTLTIPAGAKITSAMRERRTLEFRVGTELAGGLKHAVFRNMKQPLSARIVHKQNRITEVNVITNATDINHKNTDQTSGQSVIAVRPKRPPLKKK